MTCLHLKTVPKGKIYYKTDVLIGLRFVSSRGLEGKKLGVRCALGIQWKQH